MTRAFFNHLCFLLTNTNTNFLWEGELYRLRSIEREDGSGKSFNVCVYEGDTNNTAYLHLRIVD